MQSAITEHQLTPAMAAVVTRNRRRFGVMWFVIAGLWGALWLGGGLVFAITDDDIGKLVIGVLGGALGAAIFIFFGRKFWIRAGLAVASGTFLSYSGPVEIKVTESVDTDGTVSQEHHLAFENRLLYVDAKIARKVESSGGWVGVTFTPNGDFVFEVVDRQGQPLHRASGYVPALTR